VDLSAEAGVELIPNRGEWIVALAVERLTSALPVRDSSRLNDQSFVLIAFDLLCICTL